MKLKYIYLLSSLFLLFITGCKGKSTNTKEDHFEKQVTIVDARNFKGNDTLLKVTSRTKLIDKEREVIEGKKIVIVGSDSDYYYENPDYNIKKFLSKIDSVKFYDFKQRLNNKMDTMSLIKSIDNILTVPTNGKAIVYVNKPFSKFGYEGEEYEYKGVFDSLNAHVISRHVAEGFGYDLILASSGKVINLSGFPYLSNKGKLILTCRVDAENIVCGFVKIYSTNPEKEGILWGGWSDYTLLPVEAVWESDTTVLLRAEEYKSESDYCEKSIANIIYGRLTIQM